jgi:ribosome-binding ATPase YchF (GTP1/OBG family)
MQIKIGLCGLPNSGKSTFIKLVSQVEILIASYPFSTLKAQEYAVPIISDELKLFHSITQTKELIPPYLFFVDVPGLIRGAHKGEGLGNEFLSYLRGCDFILEIVRNFYKEDIPHLEGDINPLRDIQIIEEEIKLADNEIIKRAIKKLEKETTKEAKEKLSLLQLIFNNIQNNREEKRYFEYNELLKEFNLLLTKEWFLLINGKDIKIQSAIFKNIYNLDLAWELELLSQQEAIEEFQSQVYNFLNQLRKDLDLIQFFTYTKDITQGWFIKRNSSIIEAVGLIHSDFVSKFKIAETMALKEFLKIKSWEKAKSLGLVQNKGRNAVIEENEIIFVKI